MNSNSNYIPFYRKIRLLLDTPTLRHFLTVVAACCLTSGMFYLLCGTIEEFLHPHLYHYRIELLSSYVDESIGVAIISIPLAAIYARVIRDIEKDDDFFITYLAVFLFFGLLLLYFEKFLFIVVSVGHFGEMTDAVQISQASGLTVGAVVSFELRRRARRRKERELAAQAEMQENTAVGDAPGESIQQS